MDEDMSTAVLLSSIDFDLIDKLQDYVSIFEYLQSNEDNLRYLLSDDIFQKLKLLNIQNSFNREQLLLLNSLRDHLNNVIERITTSEFVIETLRVENQSLKNEIMQLQNKLSTIEGGESISKVATLLQIKNALKLNVNNKLESLSLGASYTNVSDDEISSIHERDLYGLMGTIVIHGNSLEGTQDSIVIFDAISGMPTECTSLVSKQPDNSLMILCNVKIFGEQKVFTFQNLKEYDTITITVGRHITHINFVNDELITIQYTAFLFISNFSATNMDGLPSRTLAEQTQIQTHTGRWTQHIAQFPKVKVTVSTANATLYQLCPIVHLTGYLSPVNQVLENSIYVNFMAAVAYALSLLDLKLEQTLDVALSSNQSDLDYLVLNNTSSIQHILGELQYIPKYIPFTIQSTNAVGQLSFSKPFIDVAGEIISMIAYAPEEDYANDGMVSFNMTKPNAHEVPRMFSAATFQTVNSQVPASYADEFKIWSNDDCVIYLGYRVSVEPTGNVYGGMHQLKGDLGTQRVFKKSAIQQHAGNVVSMTSGPVTDGLGKFNTRTKITWNFTRDYKQSLNLMYKGTRVVVRFTSLIIGLIDSFSVPSSIELNGTLMLSCFNTERQIELNESASKPATMSLSDGTQLFGILVDLNSDHTHTFNEVISYIIDPNAPSSDYSLISQNRSVGESGYTVQSNTVETMNNISIRIETFNSYILSSFNLYLPTTGVNSRLTMDYDTLLSRPMSGIQPEIPWDGSMPTTNQFISQCSFKLTAFTLTCMKAQSSGTGELVAIYNGALENISQLVLDITLEMNTFRQRISTLELQVKHILQWIQEQIERASKSGLDQFFDFVFQVVIGVVINAVLPGVGTLLTTFLTVTVRFASAAVKGVARVLIAIGRGIKETTFIVITEKFAMLAHRMKFLTKSISIKLSKQDVWENKLHEAFSHAKINQFGRIDPAIKHLVPELQLAETINIQTASKYGVIANNFTKNGLNVPMTLEINYHGLTAIGKSQILKEPTAQLLNSGVGMKLIARNIAPVHAYGVASKLEQIGEDIIMKRTIIGVSEGLSNIQKGISVGCFTIPYKQIGKDVNSKIFKPVPFSESNMTSTQVELLFSKYFKNSVVTDVNQQWLLLASKFSSIQNTTLKQVDFLMPDTHRLIALQDVFGKSAKFDYNLLNNNCQRFVEDVKVWLESGVVQSSLKPYSDRLGSSYMAALQNDMNLVFDISRVI